MATTKMNNIKVALLIGGPSKGTRFRPLSLHKPKPLFPIASLPLIEHHIKAATELPNCSHVFMIGFFPPAEGIHAFISSISSKYSTPITYLEEEEGLGTAGGLYRFRKQIEASSPLSHLFVMHCDVLCNFPLQDMLNFHMTHGKPATMLTKEVSNEEARLYGCVVENEETHQALHYVEKPESFVTNKVNCGVYLFSREFFEILCKVAKSLRQEAKALKLSSSPLDRYSDPRKTLLKQGDVRIRLEQDVLVSLADSQSLFCFSTNDWWMQLKHAGSAIASCELVLQNYRKNCPEKLATCNKSGLCPQIVGNVLVDPTAVIAPSAKLGPNVCIGPNVKIAAGVRVRDSILLDNVEVKEHACIIHSIIGWKSQIGQWARVAGTPDPTSPLHHGGITVLGKSVTVKPEVNIRNTIVLPHKSLDEDYVDDILL